nr:hypothetical protein [Tanacetum cinerariifolium]
MAPKRTTRSSPATTTTTTTHVTNAQLKALINQGVDDALAARDSVRSQNGEDNHDSGTGAIRVKLMSTNEREDVPRGMGAIAHGETVGHDVAYAMTWTNLEKKMTDKYYPSGEIKKLEVEMWNLKVKGTGVDAVEFAAELMDKKIRTFAECQTKNKRKQNDNQQQQNKNKRQNTGRAYTVGPGEKKSYQGSKLLCSKCNYHHDNPCAPKFHKCNRVGHLAHDCKSPGATNNQRNLTCYDCGNQGHYMSDFLELKNQNHGN